jgi:hypothetical protein
MPEERSQVGREPKPGTSRTSGKRRGLSRHGHRWAEVLLPRRRVDPDGSCVDAGMCDVEELPVSAAALDNGEVAEDPGEDVAAAGAEGRSSTNRWSRVRIIDSYIVSTEQATLLN